MGSIISDDLNARPHTLEVGADEERVNFYAIHFYLQPLISVSCFSVQVLEKSFDKFKTIHKISVVPNRNLTVTCSVNNKLGTDAKTIKVFAGELVLDNILPDSTELITCLHLLCDAAFC